MLSKQHAGVQRVQPKGGVSSMAELTGSLESRLAIKQRRDCRQS